MIETDTVAPGPEQCPLALREKSAAVFDVILFCIWHDMGFGKRRTINTKNMIYLNCCTINPINFIS